jgi:hypothetical protein
MRELTLHEKITIKGILKRYGVQDLNKLTMKEAAFIFTRCTGKSIAHYYKCI